MSVVLTFDGEGDENTNRWSSSADSNGNDRLTGNCWGDGTRGCGVFIQGGTKCEISGNDMWHAYQDIRNVGGCDKCGSWHRADGCLVTINYVSGCNNHG